VLATLATERTSGLLADGESNAAALNSGYHLAYLVGAVLVVAAIAVAIWVLQPEDRAGQEQTEHEAPPRGEPAYSETI
jgi:hypothetical protein